jgi:DNA polymerase-3 subunit delta
VKATLNQFHAQLKRELAAVYLIAGEEPLLIQEAVDALRSVARAQGFAEREILEVERGFDWSLLYEACASMSLFSSRKIVELRMPGGAPGAAGSEMLRTLAAQATPDTLLIVVCEALDARTRDGAWAQALEAAGVCLYVWPIGDAEFPAWIEARMRAAGLGIEADALELLVDRTQGNTLAAAQDIAKLALLFPDATVSAAQVAEAVADSARFDAFDLGDCMLEGDAAGAARSLARLREEGVEVIELLAALNWTLRQWAQAQVQYAQSGDAGRACEAARVPRPRQAAMRKALPRTRLTQLYGWFRRAAVIDQLAKSTGGKEQAWEELLTWVMAAAGVAPIRNKASTS